MGSIIAILYGAIVSTISTPILIYMLLLMYGAMPWGLVSPSYQQTASLTLSTTIAALAIFDLSGWISLILGLKGGGDS